MGPGATRDPWILWLGQFATVSTAAYLLIAGLTFNGGDALWFDINVKPLYIAAAVLGVLAAFIRVLRFPWLVALCICSLGRAVTLVITGSPTITDRASELRGAMGWWVLWILGSFPMLAMQASDVIRGRVEPRHERPRG